MESSPLRRGDIAGVINQPCDLPLNLIPLNQIVCVQILHKLAGRMWEARIQSGGLPTISLLD